MITETRVLFACRGAARVAAQVARVAEGRLVERVGAQVGQVAQVSDPVGLCSARGRTGARAPHDSRLLPTLTLTLTNAQSSRLRGAEQRFRQRPAPRRGQRSRAGLHFQGAARVKLICIAHVT